MRNIFTFICVSFALCLGSVRAQAEVDDQTLSFQLTRTFQEELLPHLKTGIPQLGIRSIDPIVLPDFSLTLFNIGPVRCASEVHGLVVMGLANISRSIIVIDTRNKNLTAEFLFPRAEGESKGTTSTFCWFFDRPLLQAKYEGSIQFTVERLSMVGFFSLSRSSDSEIVSLKSVDVDIEGFSGQGQGTIPPYIERVTNWLMRHFGVQFFKYFVKPGFADASTKIFNTFMDANAWRAVLGDLL